MNRCLAVMQHALLCMSVALPMALPTAAHAIPAEYNLFFGGQGSLVFHAATSTGAWTGSIDESPFPPAASPLGLLSVVSFSFDGASGMLTGMFELTSAGQFADTLIGRVDGLLTKGNFASGGQLALDYTIENGGGQFLQGAGFGISLLDFSAPVNGFNDYTEAGVLVFAVPEPAPWVLTVVGLLAVLRMRRKAAPVN